MTDDLGTPIAPEEGSGRNTTLIIVVVVVVVLLCCCCSSVALLWTYGDAILEEAGLALEQLQLLL